MTYDPLERFRVLHVLQEVCFIVLNWNYYKLLHTAATHCDTLQSAWAHREIKFGGGLIKNAFFMKIWPDIQYSPLTS